VYLECVKSVALKQRKKNSDEEIGSRNFHEGYHKQIQKNSCLDEVGLGGADIARADNRMKRIWRRR
jgi:hypothetical protein